MTALKEMVKQFSDVIRDPCDEEIVERARDVIEYFDSSTLNPQPLIEGTNDGR